MIRKHKCVEGRALGVDLDPGYPYGTLYCVSCRNVIRRVPLDDLDADRLNEALRLIRVMRDMGKRKTQGED